MLRTYFLIIAIVSIFTGMIAPTVANSTISVPYALTNMQYVAYGILASLTLLFLFLFLGWRILSQILIAFVLVAVLGLGMMTMMGIVKNFSLSALPYFSWWWIFLLIGLIFLIIAFLNEDDNIRHEGAIFGEYHKIIGITGFFTFLILSLFVIFIAEKNAKKIPETSNIKKIFSENSRKIDSGVVTSQTFDIISDFSFDRKKNILSFIGTASGATVAYPSETKISRPDDLLTVKHFGERMFFIQKTGEVIENGKWIGHTTMTEFQKNFLVFVNADNHIEVVTDAGSVLYGVYGDEPDLFTYIPSTGDLYWRVRVDGQHIIYKNSRPVTEFFPNILRYAVSTDGNITMIVEDASFTKMVVKNNTVVHTMYPSYVQGTLRMNTSDVIYAIQNDHGSFSIVLNGMILERKLEEIREVFIEQNASGFAYFGRPQGESRYCLFTRYRGNLCGLESYMNPSLEADNAWVIFAGLRNNRWSIYRNITELVRDTGYAMRTDFSYDYFFFDPTNPRRYVFVEKLADGYHINKMWKILPESWKDIDVNSLYFWENNIMFMIVQDTDGWKILEF